MALRLPPRLVSPTLLPLKWFVFNPRVPFERQRRLSDAILRVLHHVPRDVDVTPFERAGTRGVRFAAPGADPERRVVFMHGGAFCVGSSMMGRAFAAHLSRAGRAVVYSLDYRSAPEHPYPAGLDDSLALFRDFVAENAALPPVLTGDSSGANLAIGTALVLRDAGEMMPAGLGLICPFLDLHDVAPPIPYDPVLSRKWLAACAAAYVGQHDPTDPLISPVYADLVGLPRTLVFSATHDMLVRDAVTFTSRARAAGVEVEHVEAQRLWHDYPLQAGLVAPADEAVQRLALLLDQVWAGSD
jgi:epsilon-lactone hydrolase